MKLTAYQRYQYTGLAYEKTMNANNVVQYIPMDLDFRCEFVTDPNSPRSVLLTDTPLKIESVLVGIRDKDGFAILGNSQWTVRTIEPIVNIFGGHEGYRMTVSLTIESDYQNLIDRDPTYTGGIGGGG